MLYKLKNGRKTTPTIPTVGFNIENVTLTKGVTFNMWDLGGGVKAKYLWRRCVEQSKGMFKTRYINS